MRNFDYAMAEDAAAGLTAFDATNALWARVAEAKWSGGSGSLHSEPATPTSQLTSALSHFQFAE